MTIELIALSKQTPRILSGLSQEQAMAKSRSVKRVQPKKSPGRKKKAPPTKPRGEQLLDRLDKNARDREAWDELATGRRKRAPPTKPRGRP